MGRFIRVQAIDSAFDVWASWTQSSTNNTNTSTAFENGIGLRIADGETLDLVVPDLSGPNRKDDCYLHYVPTGTGDLRIHKG
jgi:hypothetical protein